MTIREQRKITRLLSLYNMIPNLLWSALGLVPISIYCYRHVLANRFSLMLVLSLFPILLPRSRMQRLMLSNSPRFYEKLGVRFINHLAQNGTVISWLVRKKDPLFTFMRPTRISVKRLIGQSYMFEKFHLVLFVFFLLVSIHAAANGDLKWMLAITACNLFYNVYPNLLQQYKRIRLEGFNKA